MYIGTILKMIMSDVVYKCIATLITIKFAGNQSSLFFIGNHKFKKTCNVLSNFEELIKGWLADLQAIKEQTFDLGVGPACL